MPDKNDLLEKTENEVSAWSIAGRTLPFVALAGFIACVFFAENWIPIYASLVIVVWVTVSVAWWWWALNKILRVTNDVSTTNFEGETRDETIKDDIKIGNGESRFKT